MKNLTIAGNIGRDATTRTTQNGDKVTGFSVAVEERNGPDKRSLWFDCSLWGVRGEKLAGFLTKGSKVAVSGELSTREHDGKTYMTLRVSDVTLLGGGQDRRDDGGRSRTAETAHRAQAPAGGRGSVAMDDEIPWSAEFR